MDLNVIKNKAENVYGEENTTEYKEMDVNKIVWELSEREQEIIKTLK